MLQHERPCQRLRGDRHASYLRHVLRLAEDDTEELLDQRLRDEAKALGVYVDPKTGLDSTTTSVFSDLSRRSQDSMTSQSTGVMSSLSDVSREQHQAAERATHRWSLSIRDIEGQRRRQSMSFSPSTTPSQSTFSLPLSSPESSPKKHFRRLRGLSMLGRRRNGSNASAANSCPHCPQDLPSQRRAVHKLPCGHRYCTQALRNLIQDVVDNHRGLSPSCCGTPVSDKLIEHVTTQAERNAVVDKLEQREESTSAERSAATGVKRPQRPARRSRTVSEESEMDSTLPKPPQDTEKAASVETRSLERQQVEQHDRFLAWIDSQQKGLEVHRGVWKEQMRARQEAAIEVLTEAHNVAMSEAEDKQVKAESKMRDTHAQEKRDNATALKHMEAYCAGNYSTGEHHNRAVTDQDLVELYKARRIRDQMDSKHESAINVLRGEQSRRIRLRAQRQEKEEQELRRAQEKDDLESERNWIEEKAVLDDFILKKRATMRVRSQSQMAVSLKRLDTHAGHMDRGPLMGVEPNDPIDRSAALGAAKQDISDQSAAGISTRIALCGTA